MGSFRRTIRTKKLFMISAICLLAVVMIAGCGQKPAASDNEQGTKTGTDEPAAVTSVSIMSAPPGGGQYPTSSAIARVITDHVGVTATVEASTGGSGQNTLMVGMGKSALGMSTYGHMYQAYQGTGFYKEPLQDVRFVLALNAAAPHLVVNAGSPIKSYKDLDGKKVAVGLAGGGADVIFREFMSVLKIEPQIVNVAHSDAKDMIRDGMIDALFHYPSIPWPLLKELEVSRDLRIIPMDDVATEIKKEIKYWGLGEIPADTYKNQPEAINVLLDRTSLVTNKSVDAEFVYKMTKAIFENKETLVALFAPTAEAAPENALGSPIYIHAGAVKYYKEIGLDLPAELIPPEYSE